MFYVNNLEHSKAFFSLGMLRQNKLVRMYLANIFILMFRNELAYPTLDGAATFFRRTLFQRTLFRRTLFRRTLFRLITTWDSI